MSRAESAACSFFPPPCTSQAAAPGRGGRRGNHWGRRVESGEVRRISLREMESYYNVLSREKAMNQMSAGPKDGRRSKGGQKGPDSCLCSRNRRENKFKDVSELSSNRVFD